MKQDIPYIAGQKQECMHFVNTFYLRDLRDISCLKVIIKHFLF